MNEQIREILTRYDDKVFDPYIHFQPDIPQIKLTGAINAYAKDVNPEAVLALIDNTIIKNAKDGGMLYARYGKGVYIYTGYSWFRQLPAGVPGAYRIFVNMISAGGQTAIKTQRSQR